MDTLYLNFFGLQKYLKDTVLFSYQHQPQQQKNIKTFYCPGVPFKEGILKQQ